MVHSDQMDVACNVLVNSAGLRAPRWRAVEGYRCEKAPREFYAKGNYYSLTRRAPFSGWSIRYPSPAALACM